MTNNNPSSIADFVKALQLEALEIERKKNSTLDERTSMGELFREALDKSIEEISHGANVHDFYLLTVANLVVIAAQEGYTAAEIKPFLDQLSVVVPGDD